MIALGVTSVLAFVIGWLTLTPSTPTPPVIALTDKAYHFIAFAGLVLPVALLSVNSLAWLIPVAFVYGGLIELLQPHVGRSGEMADLAANALGLAAGVAVAWCSRMVRRKYIEARERA